MPAASVSIHSMRRRSRIRAGSGRPSESIAMAAAITAHARRAAPPGGAAIVRRVNEQLRRRAVGAPAARSVLLTVLGEYVMPAYGSAWQETLIGALGAVGHKTHAARQALARSVSAGWLETERHGRRSRVRLAPDTAEMLRSGAARIYSFGEPWVW